MDDFIQRPTDVLQSYMAAHGFDGNEVYTLMRMGRIAMALEIITVIKLLEEHELLAEHEQTISVLQTLLVDQELMEPALGYYEELSRWRRIKVDASYEVPGVQPSEHAVPRDDAPPPDSTDALRGNGQSLDPPSSQ